MIFEIVAPPDLRSIVNTADCLDDPASIAFGGAGLKEADFGFEVRDDFDLTLDEARTVVRPFARCPDLRAVVSGLDLSLLLATWPSFA